jgi:hypothetical protein
MRVCFWWHGCPVRLVVTRGGRGLRWPKQEETSPSGSVIRKMKKNGEDAHHAQRCGWATLPSPK